MDALELMDLAEKVPPVLETLVWDKGAPHFFRRAIQITRSPEGWRGLLAFDICQISSFWTRSVHARRARRKVQAGSREDREK
jgi:hypothetical protein